METTEIVVLIVSFAGMLLLGVPIAYSIGLATLATMLVTMGTWPALTTQAQRIATGLDSFALLPLTILL